MNDIADGFLPLVEIVKHQLAKGRKVNTEKDWKHLISSELALISSDAINNRFDMMLTSKMLIPDLNGFRINVGDDLTKIIKKFDEMEAKT